MRLHHTESGAATRERAASRVALVFEQCRSEKRAAFIAFLTAGYPTLDATPALIRTVCESGADLLEIGFTYSDPIADGPVIQASSQRALENGATFDWILGTLTNVEVETPLLAFSYCNLLFVRGFERAAADLAAAGFAGAIVPDLPPEEGQTLAGALAKNGLSMNYLVAPTTPPERAAFIAQQCDDFVYVAGRMGVTGAHAAADDLLASRIAQLRAATQTPLAVGFGVSKPEHVAAVAAIADGVVVGSALIEACGAPEPEKVLRHLCASLRPQLIRGRHEVDEPASAAAERAHLP